MMPSPLAGGGTTTGYGQTCRSGSRRSWPSSTRHFHTGLAAAKACQASRAFTFDQRFQRLPDQTGLLFEAGEGLRLGHEVVVECKGRAHVSSPRGHGTYHHLMPNSMPGLTSAECSTEERFAVTGQLIVSVSVLQDFAAPPPQPSLHPAPRISPTADCKRRAYRRGQRAGSAL